MAKNLKRMSSKGKILLKKAYESSPEIEEPNAVSE